jgi:alpha-galactosidase
MKATALILLVAVHGAASLTLPAVFSDGCVLQTWDQGDARSFVYGDAPPSAAVRVSLISEDPALPFLRMYETTAMADGTWSVQLDGTYAGDATGRTGPHYGPYSMNISTAASYLAIRHVSFGDVFFCAGDESMQIPNKSPISPAPSAISRYTPALARWQSAEDGLRDFSALCTSMALSMRRLDPAGQGPGNTTGGMQMPIGLILTAAAGSTLASWAPDRAVACRDGVGAAGWYNQMVAPLRFLAIRGVAFSQAQADVELRTPAARYAECLRALIMGWRDNGQIGDFAFALVQAGIDDASGGDPAVAAALGLAQAAALPSPFSGDTSAVDTTALAATFDLAHSDFGERGRRLSLGLVHTAYAKQPPSWPVAPPFVESAHQVDSSTVLLRFVADAGAEGLRLVDRQGGDQCPPPSRLRAGAAVSEFGGGTGGTGAVVGADAVVGAGGDNGGEMAPGDSMVYGGSLAQGWCAPLSSWINASSLQLATNSVGTGLWLRFDGCVEVGIRMPVKRVRIGLGAERATCFVRNANGLPPLPMEANVTSNTVQHSPSSSVAERLGAIKGHQGFTEGRSAIKGLSRAPTVALPPLGFNTWNRWHCWVDESQLRRTADLMVGLGLVAAGYTYLNIDDCWQASRTADGSILEDPVRFPSGLRAFSAYAHARGLRFGLYTSQTELTCQARPGSYGHELADAAAYCAADADYLKIDACGGQRYAHDNASWALFRNGLDECAARRKRPFVMSCSSCGIKTGGGVAGCGQWIAQMPVGCDVWRTGDDIQARWTSVLTNLKQNTEMAPVQNSHPGHYNDPDMLQVGNVGLSLTEQRAHFTLWAAMGGPLLISTDLQQISASALEILKNAEILEINQDALGRQGTPIALPAANRTYDIYAKPLAGGDLAVILLNLGDTSATIELDLAMLPIAFQRPSARDLWAHRDLGVLPPVSQFSIASHDVLALRLQERSSDAYFA